MLTQVREKTRYTLSYEPTLVTSVGSIRVYVSDLYLYLFRLRCRLRRISDRYVRVCVLECKRIALIAVLSDMDINDIRVCQSRFSF